MEEYFVKLVKDDVKIYTYFDTYRDAKLKFLEIATDDIKNIKDKLISVAVSRIKRDWNGIHEDDALDCKIYHNNYYCNNVDESYYKVDIELRSDYKLDLEKGEKPTHNYSIIYDNEETINESIKVIGECQYFNRI